MALIHVLGLGLGAPRLDPVASEILDRAQVLVGGRRQLALFPEHPARREPILAPVAKTVQAIAEAEAQGLRVVVLADGDPLFYGIGRTLTARLGRDKVRCRPGLTAVQVAANRLGLSWSEARVVSLHGRNDLAPLFAALTHHDLVGVYTDERNTPGFLARCLLTRGADAFAMAVAEDLDSETERVGTYSLEQAAAMSFSATNFVFLERTSASELRLGLGMDDADFIRQAGLITKGPIRAAGLAALRLSPSDTLWDLGAGCGAVGIEASALLLRGQVLACEQRPERLAMLTDNIRRSGAYSVRVVAGSMPQTLSALPDPDAVFIGGGLRAPGLPETVLDRLKPGGRLVAHVVLLESLETIRRALAKRGWPAGVQQLWLARDRPLAGDVHLQAQNPVFIVTSLKPGAAGTNAAVPAPPEDSDAGV